MTTTDDLVSSIASSLHSYTGVQESYTWLLTGATDTDLTLNVADASAIFRGIAEIDDEMIFVHSGDAQSLTLAPFGRGYRGSSPASHAANTQVTFDPAFPRSEVKKRITKAVKDLFPTLYQIGSVSYAHDGIAVNYAVPGKPVLITFTIPGDPAQVPYHYYDWRWDGGTTVVLCEPIPTGAQIKITCQQEFGDLVALGDFTAAGIPESCADLIEYAVTAHMIRYLDPGRLILSSVENVSRAQVIQVGDAAKIANQLYTMYQQRLQEERRKLLLLNPPTINFQG